MADHSDEKAPGWLERQVWRVLKKPGEPGEATAEQAAAHDILNMLEVLGLVMLEVGQATNEVEESLRAIAKAYQLTDARTIVLPTVIVLQSEQAGGEVRIQSARVAGGRLDQAGAIELLTARALRAEVSTQDAVAEARRIRSAKPRFGAWMTLVGHIVLTVGFGMVINPTAQAIPIYVGLGAGVGGLVLLSRKLPGLTATVPVVAAFGVTLITTLVLVHVVGGEPLKIIAPPLVSFLPGTTLTIAAIELTNNQVVAGASRIVYGVAQLLLLVFGVFAASTVAGTIRAGTVQPTLGPWAGILGVALVAIGFMLFMSAPKGALPWIFLSLAVCYGAQALGVLALGPALSGFVGAVVVAPFARIASSFRTSPPAAVMSLASFWLLVPGALGFIGLSGVLQGGAGGVTALTTAGISVLAIALGAIVGVSLSRDGGRLLRLARRK
ncbi:threonine/serine ThrE exporter family protein [Lacisediminihabitans changchengi]|uniref:Threonine/serine exporter family protein n=1 Tax=Lacisediminihabitans changchengi TaxID=2787634 RepID=A0A934SL52_9MICO|nr:threonine/serine exporter family protein [Lacisediminihabitans changchengi]MBK4346917.1 threonine/serine exporter family protein [Lacisediminihabitans changchengi]MBK4347960.1 threonine/serine exporter family protein [Lacisediminihabitans changchengi]